MKLFSSTQISWSEPWFFIIRLREPWGWSRRLMLALGISLVMFLAIFFGGKPQWGIPRTIGTSLMAGFVLVALLDVVNIQREVTIQNDCIICNSAVGTHRFTSFNLKDVQQVQLMHPDEWKKPWGAMLIQTDSDTFLTGVPRKVALHTIANILHRLQVSVVLTGWEPSDVDTRIQVKDEIVVSPESVRGVARVWAVEATEPGLTPPSTVAMQLVMAIGPLALSFLGMIAAGIYLYRTWDVLSVLNKCLISGGAVAVFLLSFYYLLVIGQFVAARYGVGVAEKILRTRVNSLLSGLETDSIPVEVFDRTAWTSVMARSIDFGFLQIDPGRRTLKFEGNKNRWEIPTSALRACKIEESHVGSEANQNAEKRYYVVIGADYDGKPWEAGMIHTRTEIGSDSAEKRYSRARALFSQVAAMV